MARKKIHPNFPSYAIYDDGRIQSIKEYKEGKTKTVYRNPHYLKFLKLRAHPTEKVLFANIINKKGLQQTVYIHKLVAQLFIPNPESKKMVHHKNDDFNNNHYSNLLWISQADSNFIQYKKGKRNPAEEAKTMRKNGGIKDWTKTEIKRLLHLKDSKKLNWKRVAIKMKGRTLGTCQVKYSTLKNKN